MPHRMTNTFGEGKNVHTSVADYIGLFAVAALAFYRTKAALFQAENTLIAKPRMQFRR